MRFMSRSHTIEGYFPTALQLVGNSLACYAKAYVYTTHPRLTTLYSTVCKVMHRATVRVLCFPEGRRGRICRKVKNEE